MNELKGKITQNSIDIDGRISGTESIIGDVARQKAEIKAKINVSKNVIGSIAQQAVKITGSVSKPKIQKLFSPREGIITLIMLGTAYAPSGIVSNIEEVSK